MSAPPEPARPDPARPDPARPDPARRAPARPDPARLHWIERHDRFLNGVLYVAAPVPAADYPAANDLAADHPANDLAADHPTADHPTAGADRVVQRLATIADRLPINAPRVAVAGRADVAALDRAPAGARFGVLNDPYGL